MIKNALSFLGDISLNDRYNELYKEGVSPFAEVVKGLSKSDLVIGNLECLAEGSFGENLLKKPRLKTNFETLNYLKDINLGLALLAHNHVYDNLEDGFKKTLSFLNDNNVAHIGAGLTPQDAEKPFIKEFNGARICILNYVTHDTNPKLPDDATIYLNWFEEKKVIADIKKLKQTCDKVILCLHWGGRCEGGRYPDWEQPFIARRLIDAGAELIIGTHSHTIQPHEDYNGKKIYYSLGNFCFSPIPESKIKKLHPSQRKGLIVSTNMNIKDNYVLNNYYIENKNCYIYQANFRFRSFQDPIFKALSKFKFLWNFYYFYLKKIKMIFNFIFYYDGNIYIKLKGLNQEKLKRFLNIKL